MPPKRIAVVGGGHVGLEAALYCARLGHVYSGDEQGLFQRLDELLLIARDSLEVKRKVIQRLMDAGVLYAPDYVINAGGIISVLRKVDRADDTEVNARIDKIPGRLESIWRECDSTGQSADAVADRMAQELIGR